MIITIKQGLHDDAINPTFRLPSWKVGPDLETYVEK